MWVVNSQKEPPVSCLWAQILHWATAKQLHQCIELMQLSPINFEETNYLFNQLITLFFHFKFQNCMQFCTMQFVIVHVLLKFLSLQLSNEVCLLSVKWKPSCLYPWHHWNFRPKNRGKYLLLVQERFTLWLILDTLSKQVCCFHQSILYCSKVM